MKYFPNFELEMRNAIYNDLGEAEKCAKDGNPLMANIIYNTNRLKVQKLDNNADLKRALRRLKTVMNDAYARSTVQPTIEHITIPCVLPDEPSPFNPPQPGPAPGPSPDRDRDDDDEGVPKPEYCDWEEAEKLYK